MKLKVHVTNATKIYPADHRKEECAQFENWNWNLTECFCRMLKFKDLLVTAAAAVSSFINGSSASIDFTFSRLMSNLHQLVKKNVQVFTSIPPVPEHSRFPEQSCTYWFLQQSLLWLSSQTQCFIADGDILCLITITPPKPSSFDLFLYC